MAEKKIGNRSFRCEKMPADEGVLYSFRIGKLASPLIGQIQNLVSGVDEVALTALAEFLQSLDPVEGQEIVMKMAGMAEVKSSESQPYEPVIFNITFQDDLLEAFQVAAWVIMVNFGGFFKGRLASMLPVPEA